ncbi:MAG: tyrosine-type recombinase/integrase [Planctomycetota bacterium]
MTTIRDALLKYIAVRRALGTQLREPAVTLGYFVDFLEREKAEFITINLALRWACEPENVQPATWARRLTMVRRFACWLSAFEPRTQVPPKRLLNARHRRNKPYIFTDQEIDRLMAEAAQLPSPAGLRALTHSTLIGLLAATGLRPGEAMNLDLSDVDLENGILAIRQTKFGKSRFVPIEGSTSAALAQYVQWRRELCALCQTDRFLVSENGTRLQDGTARRTFAKVSHAIGLRQTVRGKRVGRGPRLQDFRHTFATRKLIEWYRAGLDVEREMPKLATYLGHTNVSHTYWYIEAVPELLQLATEYMSQRGGAQ